jgi:uncharacterized membrane protein
VLALPFLMLPASVTAMAALAVIAVGNAFTSPLFNPPWLVWLGFATQVPPTVDFYPVFPWFGAVLAGLAAGKVFLASGAERAVAQWRPADPVTRFLALAGRWSLVIYLLHQVVLFSAVSLAASYIGPRPPEPPAASRAPADAGTLFMNECLPACAAQGQGVATCTTYCGCMFAGLSGTDILATPAERLSEDQRQRLGERSRVCAAAVPPRAAPPAN